MTHLPQTQLAYYRLRYASSAITKPFASPILQLCSGFGLRQNFFGTNDSTPSARMFGRCQRIMDTWNQERPWFPVQNRWDWFDSWKQLEMELALLAKKRHHTTSQVYEGDNMIQRTGGRRIKVVLLRFCAKKMRRKCSRWSKIRLELTSNKSSTKMRTAL